MEERLNSEEIRLEIDRRIEEGRKKMLDEVAVLLEKEKESTLSQAKQKEVISLSISSFLSLYVSHFPIYFSIYLPNLLPVSLSLLYSIYYSVYLLVKLFSLSLSLSLLPRSSIFLAIYLTLCLSLPRFFLFLSPISRSLFIPLYTYLFHFLCLFSSYLSPHPLLFLGLKMV